MTRCPACGFESSESAAWCDFCKEPFRQARKPAEAAPGKTKDPAAGIPPEFLALDSGGKVPMLPGWCRYAAWAALCVWLAALMLLLGAYMARKSALEDRAAIQGRFQADRNN